MGFCNVVELRLQQQRLLLERSLKLPQAIGRREGNTEIWVFSCFVSASTARKQAGCCCCWGGEGAYRNHVQPSQQQQSLSLPTLWVQVQKAELPSLFFPRSTLFPFSKSCVGTARLGFIWAWRWFCFFRRHHGWGTALMWNVCLFWEEWYLVIWTSYLVCWWKIAFPLPPIFLPVGPAEGMNHSPVTSTVCSKNTVTPGVSLSNNNKMNKFNFLSVLGLCS